MDGIIDMTPALDLAFFNARDEKAFTAKELDLLRRLVMSALVNVDDDLSRSGGNSLSDTGSTLLSEAHDKLSELRKKLDALA
jgi:hypothetical protein